MLSPLHDRVSEMASLASAFDNGVHGTPQLVILSGHRRVGKTFLLLHAMDRVADQRTVFFSATQQSEYVELSRFSEALRPVFSDEPLLADAVPLGNWERALTAIIGLARTTPIILVIDEAPYLEQSTPGFISVVQTVWDRLTSVSAPTHLTLVLTGSAPTVMEQMVGPHGPLRGRATSHLRLKPFDLPTVARIWDLPPADAIEAYAACGGWPLHVAAWDTTSTAAENRQRLAGEAGGILLEDADLILRELPYGPGFGRVLAAVGRGRTKYGDIATDAGQRVEYALEFLTDSGLVLRETPVGAPRRARPRYSIDDPYLRFWFTVLHNDRARIEGGMGAAVLRSRQGEWARHLGWVFEAEARAHARRITRDGHLDPMSLVGRWWSSGKRPVEIDVLAMHDGRTIMVGEAKCSAGPFDPRWVDSLTTDLGFVPDPIDRPQRWIWTRANAPGDLPKDVTVFGPGDMVE
ncbi:MAG: ATP-binding protein [Euzebya sp.]